jgi:hypothetical protein
MGSFKLARRLPSTSILTEPWLGTTVTGRPVVAHLCKEPWAKTNFVTRFAGFHRGWQGLRQAGVAPLLEVGQAANGGLWVVEEFIEGETARTLMNAALSQKSPLSVAEALAIAQQVARGLVTLSRQLPPLHHGDVCGSTIIIGTDGDVRLGGVGVAEAIDADGTLGPARAELFVMAPEALAPGSTPQSDVFKLGLVLLELLTGRTLFAGTSHAEVKARAEKYPGLTPQHFPNFPPAVAALLAGMLAKEPSARPGCVEVESALGKALTATGAPDDKTPVAGLFNRLFKGRTPMLKGLEGTEPLALTPLPFPAASAAPTQPSAQVGATNADGSVTLAKVRTTRMTSEEMAVVRANEAAEAARVVAAEWAARHAGDDSNPKDFALGQLLIEKQRISVEHADAALQQSQSFGSTLFYSLCFLGHLDEDEGLPFAAELLKQRFVTGPQLIELGLTTANAPLLPRETAEQWQVVPLKLEAGALTVAITDPRANGRARRGEAAREGARGERGAGDRAHAHRGPAAGVRREDDAARVGAAEEGTACAAAAALARPEQPAAARRAARARRPGAASAPIDGAAATDAQRAHCCARSDELAADVAANAVSAARRRAACACACAAAAVTQPARHHLATVRRGALAGARAWARGLAHDWPRARRREAEWRDRRAARAAAPVREGPRHRHPARGEARLRDAVAAGGVGGAGLALARVRAGGEAAARWR